MKHIRKLSEKIDLFYVLAAHKAKSLKALATDKDTMDKPIVFPIQGSDLETTLSGVIENLDVLLQSTLHYDPSIKDRKKQFVEDAGHNDLSDARVSLNGLIHPSFECATYSDIQKQVNLIKQSISETFAALKNLPQTYASNITMISKDLNEALKMLDNVYKNAEVSKSKGKPTILGQPSQSDSEQGTSATIKQVNVKGYANPWTKEQMAQIQNQLNSALQHQPGYVKLNPDGEYGDLTRAALKQYRDKLTALSPTADYPEIVTELNKMSSGNLLKTIRET